MAFRIVPYRPSLRPAFVALNRAWIEQHFTLEPSDLHTLDDPEGTILTPGGEVFFVLDEAGAAVGTCALVPAGPGTFELAKMAVAPEAQGRGLGRRLLAHALDTAERRGATRVFLLTNSSLAPALHLYRTGGFVDVPVDHHDYARGDVQMEIALPRPVAGPSR